MRLSVVVPTYQRPDSLRRSLDSLRTQTFKDFEILVVDNVGDPDTEGVVLDCIAAAPVPTRYFVESCLGVHNARHHGAREAHGDVLVFTDDDATFEPDWLEAFADDFDRHPEMAAAGGPIALVWEEPPPLWLVRFIGASRTFPALGLLHKDGGFGLSADGVFFGANMAIRRSVLFEVGGFNPESFGDTWLGDGETGLLRKLWSRGMLVGYVPEALVHHHVPKSHMSHDYLVQRWANEGACTEYARFRGTVPTARALLLRRCRIALSVVRLLLVTPLRRPIRKDPSGWLKLKVGMAYNRSRFRYLSRLSRDEELRANVERDVWLSASD